MRGGKARAPLSKLEEKHLEMEETFPPNARSGSPMWKKKKKRKTRELHQLHSGPALMEEQQERDGYQPHSPVLTCMLCEVVLY